MIELVLAAAIENGAAGAWDAMTPSADLCLYVELAKCEDGCGSENDDTIWTEAWLIDVIWESFAIGCEYPNVCPIDFAYQFGICSTTNPKWYYVCRYKELNCETPIPPRGQYQHESNLCLAHSSLGEWCDGNFDCGCPGQ